VSAAVLWSGGKDCFAAGLRSGALEEAGTRLVTFVPADEAVAFRCHPLGVMRRQAEELGLRHGLVEIDRDPWEASYRRAFAALAAEGVVRVVTGFRGMRVLEEDPAASAHVERDGIWALDWPATYMSDFH
jgi:diphthamide synthase (EF-2-diphthine--ammonia ligase)